MLKNYIKLIFRNLWKNKTTSAINLTGLTIGIGCSLLLLVYVRYESSFDTFSDDSDSIFFHYYEQKGANARYVGLSSDEDYKNFVTNYASIEDVLKLRNNEYTLVPAGNPSKKIDVNSWFSSPNFFDFFDFPLVDGNTQTVLSDPSSIVITQEIAAKLFGNENPIGKTVTIDASSFQKDLIVTGIAESVSNSHIQFEAILPWDMTAPDGRQIAQMWFQRSLFTYVKTVKGKKIDDLLEEANRPLIENGDIEEYELLFKPLEDVYLGSGNIQFMAFESGNRQTINGLFYIAIIILLVASINYVNLQTAKGVRRSLEVGVRKMMGAYRTQLVGQFLLEAIILTMLASVLAVLLIDLSLPSFNELTGKSFTMDFLYDQGLAQFLVMITFITALLSGVYPAFILSSFKPSRILKSSSSANSSGRNGRRALIFVQFGISVFLISVTFIAFQQTQFINKKDQKYYLILLITKKT